MKTTIDLPENLLAEVRSVAELRGWTVRVVFEESLRAFIDQQAASDSTTPFQLQHTIVGGTEPPGMTFAEMLEATNPSRIRE